MTTFLVSLVDGSVCYGNNLVRISDTGGGVVPIAPAAHPGLQCWAVEVGPYKQPDKTKPQEGPMTAVLTNAMARPEQPVEGPPPPTIRPHGAVAGSTLVLAASSFDAATSALMLAGAPASILVIAWGDQDFPLKISDLSSRLAAAAGPGDPRRFHVYNVVDSSPGVKHALDKTTIAIPVPLK